MYSRHVYASQLNLNYSGVVDDQMMVLVEILHENKAVSHCDLLSDVREVIGYFVVLCFFLPARDDDQGCRNSPCLSLNLVYLNMSHENQLVSMIYVGKPFSSDEVYMSEAVVVFLMGSTIVPDGQ